MATWQFVQKSRNQKSREAMQGEFFANSSIDSDIHALVREGIQNSLDAKADDNDGPVQVRIFISDDNPASPEVMSKYITDEAWPHFHAKNNGLTEPPNYHTPCNYLVYEDFGTTGLVGDIEQHDYIEGEKNPFYFFMRAEGQSGKSDEDRGRWGVGKFVFPHASAIRSFFMFTVRNDDNKKMMAGQCILKSHEVDGLYYTPDGWYGDFDIEDGFQLPDLDSSEINLFCKNFNIARNGKSPGLSIVIPYVNKEFSAEQIITKVISEYFFPVLSNHLIVTVENASKKIIIDNEYLLNGYQSDVELYDSELIEMLSLAEYAISIDDAARFKLNKPEKISHPKWEDRLDEEIAGLIRKRIDNDGEIAAIRVPVYVKEKSKNAVESYFDMYIKRDESAKEGKPLYVREGIKIPEVNSRAMRGYRCLVIIDDKPIATMLGDAENPAHTEWEKNSSKYKNKYEWGPSTIDFMRGCVTRFMHFLNQTEEEEDVTVLADIFYLDMPEPSEDVPDSRKQRKKKPEPGEVDPNKPEIPKPIARKYKLNKVDGGFTVHGPNSGLRGKYSYLVKAAYDREKGSPWKKYSINDFNFGDDDCPLEFESDGIDEIECYENQLKFNTDDPEFYLKVTGFDKNRDIIVDVNAMEVSDEKI